MTDARIRAAAVAAAARLAEQRALWPDGLRHFAPRFEFAVENAVSAGTLLSLADGLDDVASQAEIDLEPTLRLVTGPRRLAALLRAEAATWPR